jgi:hypothetical protein
LVETLSDDAAYGLTRSNAKNATHWSRHHVEVQIHLDPDDANRVLDRVGGTTRTLRDGTRGWRLNEKDACALADSIARWFERPAP